MRLWSQSGPYQVSCTMTFRLAGDALEGCPSTLDLAHLDSRLLCRALFKVPVGCKIARQTGLFTMRTRQVFIQFHPFWLCRPLILRVISTLCSVIAFTSIGAREPAPVSREHKPPGFRELPVGMLPRLNIISLPKGYILIPGGHRARTVSQPGLQTLSKLPCLPDLHTRTLEPV